jgi:hypothetical protein
VGLETEGSEIDISPVGQAQELIESDAGHSDLVGLTNKTINEADLGHRTARSRMMLRIKWIIYAD